MPIKKIDWECGIKTDSYRSDVMMFLKKNVEYAFTIPEIMVGIGIQKSNIKNLTYYNQVYDCLMLLSMEGLVSMHKVKMMGGQEDAYFQCV